ncbi:MAG: phosphoribosylamine--glycine ligase [Ruminococcus sp.]|jgi:phosphoribosylamine--glycine ligase|nr:phosphoribosylamine--glycine ligase [Ruminococcus sp.]
MKILVIGSGGREHAVILKLRESEKKPEIFCTPGNGGISRFAKCFDVKVNDKEGLVALAKEIGADLVVVTPEEPLALGVADALEAAGIKAFGPSAAAALIEASKVFSKNLMKKYGIPTARYETFSEAGAAKAYLKAQNDYPTVIKADGLAAGKGVIIAENEAQAYAAIEDILENDKFGRSGSQVVIEEFLTGPEVSVLAFVDGETVRPLVSSMDHKRIGEGDTGLNTGGMGTIAPNPYYTEAAAKECFEKIFIPTAKAMCAEGKPFRGLLYFGLMLTKNGAKVIEYNCRFGDPETQVVLPLLDGDLCDIMTAIADGKLAETHFGVKDGAAACVIISSGGYPEKYETGFPVNGLDSNGQAEGITVYHAGTSYKDGRFLSSGGRVLGLTAAGENLAAALEKCYAAAEKINFEGSYFRKDIGGRKYD